MNPSLYEQLRLEATAIRAFRCSGIQSESFGLVDDLYNLPRRDVADSVEIEEEQPLIDCYVSTTAKDDIHCDTLWHACSPLYPASSSAFWVEGIGLNAWVVLKRCEVFS